MEDGDDERAPTWLDKIEQAEGRAKERPTADNTEAAIALAEAGAYIFPCEPGGERWKAPLRGLRWQAESTNDVERVRRWWKERPDALIGLDCEKNGLVVLDADAADGKRGPHELISLQRQHGQFPPGPRARTARAGQHVFFRQPPGRMLGNSPGLFRHHHIDVRGKGYVIVNSEDVDGLLWGDQPGFPNLVDALHDEEIPIVPRWVVDMIDEVAPPSGNLGGVVRREDLPEGRPPLRGDAPERMIPFCRNGLDAVCAEIAATPEGGRGSKLYRGSYRIGRMLGGGWLSRLDVNARLLAAADACGLLKKDGRRRVERERDRGLAEGMLDPLLRIDDDIQTDDAPLTWDGADEIPSEEDIRAALADGTHLKIPGFIPELPVEALPEGTIFASETLAGRIARWIWTCGEWRSEAFAELAAITILATLYQRKFETWTGLGLATYSLVLAQSGLGKGALVGAPRRLFDAADAVDQRLRMAQQYVGAADITSDSALERIIAEKTSSILPLDEIGLLLKRLARPNAKSHEMNIRKILLEIHSASSGTWQGRARASGDLDPPAVRSHGLSVLGVSTIVAFRQAMGGGDEIDGFLSRFVVATADPRMMQHDPDFSGPPDPPADVVEDVIALETWAPPGASLWRHQCRMPSARAGERDEDDLPQPPMSAPTIRVPRSEAAHDALRAISTWVATIRRDDPTEMWGAAVARATEHTSRVATVWALSEHPHAPDRAIVRSEHVWAAFGIVWRSIQTLRLSSVAQPAARGEFEELCVAIVDALRAHAGAGPMPEWLLRRARGVRYKPNVDRAIQTLERAGQIVRVRRGKRQSMWRLPGES